MIKIKPKLKLKEKITIKVNRHRDLENEDSNILNKFETVENVFHYQSINQMTYVLQQHIPNNKENDLTVNIEIDNNDWEQVMQTEPTNFFAESKNINITSYSFN